MDFPNFTIKPNGPISRASLNMGLNNFQEACEFIKSLRYQRISVRSNLLLVLEEKRGTCSSKHAFLKKLAEENTVNNIDLIIGIYKMTATNTPGLEGILPENISFIPEAHAYLVFNNHRFDFTRANIKPLKDEDILEEVYISADAMGHKKEQLHKDFLRKWCNGNEVEFNEIWKIRESCIERLSM